jgi:ATP-dependent Clp protease ATP-binding subunit ClpX
MARKAKATGTGARALRMIAESTLRDLMFEVPSDPSIKEIYVEKESIAEGKPPKIVRDQSA